MSRKGGIVRPAVESANVVDAESARAYHEPLMELVLRMWRLCLTSCLVGSVLAPVLAGSAFGAPDPQRVRWLRKQAIPLTTAEPGSGFDDLRPLKRMIGKARVVALGEPTHGSREVFQMKHRLLEYLASERASRCSPSRPTGPSPTA